MKNLLNAFGQLFNALGQNWKVLSIAGVLYLAYTNVPTFYRESRDYVAKKIVESYIYENPITIKYAPATRKEALHYVTTTSGELGDYIYIVWELQTRLNSCQSDLDTVVDIAGHKERYAISEIDGRNL